MTMLLNMPKPLHSTPFSATFARVQVLRKTLAHQLAAAFPAAEEACELNHVFETVWAGVALRFEKVFISRTHEAVLRVRLSETELKRVLTLMLQGLAASASWRDREAAGLCINIRPCLNGFCALLEIADDQITLPAKLLSNLARAEGVVTTETAGGQLLKARDLAARHGGRLSIESPLHGANCGTAIRLFLPLTSGALLRESSERGHAAHGAVI